jgi:hypothetical protein
MSLDVEMRRSNSPITDHELDVDPAVVSSVPPGPEKAVFNFKESERHPGTRAALAPSVIWSLVEEYQRNKRKFWCCGICKKTKILAI